jgi:hypothetical protein
MPRWSSWLAFYLLRAITAEGMIRGVLYRSGGYVARVRRRPHFNLSSNVGKILRAVLPRQETIDARKRIGA